jgi:hypothetical protein
MSIAAVFIYVVRTIKGTCQDISLPVAMPSTYTKFAKCDDPSFKKMEKPGKVSASTLQQYP